MQRLLSHPREIVAMIVRLIAAALALSWIGLAMADPPMRVARLGYLSGTVTFSPAGENDWVSGTLNRPLITGDRLWADKNGRVELQIGSAVARLSASTLFTLTNLDDRIAQMNLQQGTLLLRVRRVDRNQVIEVDTPNLALVISQPGEYRITVNADADSTAVITRSGRANVYDAAVSYSVAPGRGYRFFGAGLADYDVLATQRPDDFDRWAQARDRGYDASISARYVSRDVIGYQDLDQYGSWSSVPDYGNVWMPMRVAADWAPYRDGHWSWIEPWGWTWVDDQPWGFAVSHYGRWTNTSRGWGWIPGPIAARPVYAPALVAFIGGSNFQVNASSGNSSGNVGAVGWFPLGPREIYRPAYAVSRNYFTNVNVSNTVINNTIIVNNYDNRNVPDGNNAVYANRTVRGAVVTVPTSAFAQSQSVARAQLRVSEAALTQAPVNTLAVVAPQRISVLGAAPQQQKPPQVVERRVVAQSMPPAAVVGFAVRERALIANPGKPMEAAALAALKSAAPLIAAPMTAAPASAGAKPGGAASPTAPPRVEIVQPRTIGPASTVPQAPPPPPPTPKQPSDRRGNPADAPQIATPAPRDPNPVVAPAPVTTGVRPATPVAPLTPTTPELAKPGNRSRDERGQPVVAPPAPAALPAPVRAPPAAAVPAQPPPAPPVQQVVPTTNPVAAPPAPAAQRGPNAMPSQQPPGERNNKPREQREAPTTIPAVPVAPPGPVQNVPPVARPAPSVSPPQPALPPQPIRPPVAAPVERAPVERAPVEPQRGRPERPEPAKPAPVVPANPAPRAPEPAKAVSAPPKAESGEQKPRIVEDRRNEKRAEKKDEKKDEKADDEEKKRK